MTDAKFKNALKGEFITGTTKIDTLTAVLLIFRKIKIKTDVPRGMYGFPVIIVGKDKDAGRILRSNDIPDKLHDFLNLIGSLIDFDGYIHGKSLVICSKPQTEKWHRITHYVRSFQKFGTLCTIWKDGYEIAIRYDLGIIKYYIYHLKKRLKIIDIVKSKERVICVDIPGRPLIKDIEVIKDGEAFRYYIECSENFAETLRRVGISLKRRGVGYVVKGDKALFVAIMEKLGFDVPYPPYKRRGDLQKFILNIERFKRYVKIK